MNTASDKTPTMAATCRAVGAASGVTVTERLEFTAVPFR